MASSYAAAQSNVVMYGYIDIGIAKNSEGSLGLERGYNNWLGLRGQEILGNGLEAIFTLETRFNLDTGQVERPTTFWQGESTVGLRSTEYGTLRLGRALTPLWDAVWKYEPWINSGFNASLAAYQTGSYTSDGVRDIDLGYADFSRISQGVFYTSPLWNGIAVHAAMKVSDDSIARSRPRSIAIYYTDDLFSTVLAYEVNARSDDIYYLGAKYKIGKASIMGSYARHHKTTSGQERTWLLAGTYTVKRGMIRAGYGRNQDSRDKKISTGFVHPLSKRTTIYADVYREPPRDRNGVAFGITHSF